MMKALDLIGQIFGDLTPEIKENKDGHNRWRCRCKCGNYVWAFGWQLKAGHFKNCGCNYTQRLIGKRFGKLLVIENKGPEPIRRRTTWLCKCDCGSMIITLTRYLERGSKIDCGCGNQERRIQMGLKRHKPNNESAINRVYWEYKSNATRKNLTFDLSVESVGEFIMANCFYCNAKPSREIKLKGYEKPLLVNGLDRLDSAKGYEAPNVTTCCWRCNHMKSDLHYTDFLDHISKIKQWQEA